MRQQSGFTLVEILVAISVLSLAMVALSQTLGATALAYRDIDDTRLAHMVASDKLVEMQVFQQWPGIGTDDDSVERGGREWWIRTRISEGPYPDTRRLDIEVGPVEQGDRGSLAYSLASLIGKPAK